MINRDDFLVQVIGLFDETDPNEITLNTEFRSLDEWSSLNGMSLIAMSSDEYAVKLTPADLQKVNTFEELAKLIEEKSNN
ncbi:MAG: acyl carrier protein [Sphingobacteriaceae bacterium]|nr:acyl carrier protein [Sphingobacteriaceae bacterium]